MSAPDATQLRSETQYTRDEKGKFTGTQADAEIALPGAHGNQDMTNILRHIGIDWCRGGAAMPVTMPALFDHADASSNTEALESKLNDRDATVSKRDAELVESKRRIEKFTEKTREGMQSALNSLMKK
jgi:hypothetical protein